MNMYIERDLGGWGCRGVERRRDGRDGVVGSRAINLEFNYASEG